MRNRHTKKYIISLLAILCSCPMVFCSIKAAATTDPGGIKVSLLSDPEPVITVDLSHIKTNQYFPIKLKGVADNSATSWTSFVGLSSTGLSFIADFNIELLGAGEQLDIQSLHDNIVDAFKNVPETFKMTLDDLPGSQATVKNMSGFQLVKGPEGNTVLRVTMRGNSEDGATGIVWNYYKAKLPLDRVRNTISFSCNRNFFISKNGLDSDESPGKVNTKGQEVPEQADIILVNINFYNWDQCEGSWTDWTYINLKDGAKPSQDLSVNIPTWSSYLSPWDSEGEYNLDKASFNEVNGVTSQLPGGYLTPMIQWNLKKDGPPTEEMLAKRFGRVVNYFDKTVDSGAHVTAKGTKTSQGQDFVLSDNDDGILKRSVTVKTLYTPVASMIDPHGFGQQTFSNRQTIPLDFGVNAPTSNKATLWEAVDDGEFKEIQTYDLSKDDPDDIAEKKAELPVIKKIGKHTLHFKLMDTNGLESKVKDLPVTIDQRDLVTKDTEIRQYNHWDKTSGIVSVKNENGDPADFGLVEEKGVVDTSKIGKYPVTYNYDGMTNSNTVSVLESLSELKTKDITLTVADTFDPKLAFVSAKDNDGKALSFKDVKVEGADKVNTRKVGDYTLIYSLGDIAPIKKTVTVHVQKGTLSLSELPEINFPALQLDGKTHELIPDEKDKKLVITDRRGLDSAGWQLQAKYSGVTPEWDRNKFNLLANLTTKDPALEIPKLQFTFNHEEQLVCDVPKAAIPKELLDTTVILSPKLQVPERVVLGEDQAIISWNLIEAPEK